MDLGIDAVVVKLYLNISLVNVYYCPILRTYLEFEKFPGISGQSKHLIAGSLT